MHTCVYTYAYIYACYILKARNSNIAGDSYTRELTQSRSRSPRIEEGFHICRMPQANVSNG